VLDSKVLQTLVDQNGHAVGANLIGFPVRRPKSARWATRRYPPAPNFPSVNARPSLEHRWTRAAISPHGRAGPSCFRTCGFYSGRTPAKLCVRRRRRALHSRPC
jgi:hypothetical protein